MSNTRMLPLNFSGSHFLFLLINGIQVKCEPTCGITCGPTSGDTRDILTCLTALSDSPTHLLNSSGPFTAKKLSPLSVASALATRVLLQPGGPYIRIPLGGRIPSRWNACRKKSTKCYICNEWTKKTQQRDRFKLSRIIKMVSTDRANASYGGRLRVRHSEVTLYIISLSNNCVGKCPEYFHTLVLYILRRR